jgi:diguanylate cyclase (GGDEF)-like protein/PAS domain S-box-containing protein
MKKDDLGKKEKLFNELGEVRKRKTVLKHAELELLPSSKKEWEETFDAIGYAITVQDGAFNILRANKAAEALVALPSGKLAGKKCYEVFHGTDEPPPDCPCYALYKTGKPAIAEKFEPHLNRYVEMKAVPFFDQNADIVKVVLILQDITERKQLEERLRESEEKYRSVVEATDDSIYIVDKDCRYLFINKEHQRRLGISDEDYMKRSFGDYHSREETRWFTERIKKILETGQTYRGEHMSDRDGYYFFLTLSPIRGVSGEINAISTISRNITEFKQMQDKLLILSITDDLTGLYNRRGFFSMAEQQLRIAARNKRGVFLVYADIDNLKMVNDKFGHIVGDQLIVGTANVLKRTFRNSDIIARIGGDEFVIFPVDANAGKLDAIYGRLNDTMDQMNLENAGKYPISLTIGKAHYDPAAPCSVEELLHMADVSMYESKSNKKRGKR